MKILITLTALLLFAFSTPQGAQASPGDDDDSIKYAKAVKLYIAAEHKKRKTKPDDDFEKIHKVCGKAQGWTKGCRFWKQSGKDEYGFQVRPKGKIYGIPSFLR